MTSSSSSASPSPSPKQPELKLKSKSKSPPRKRSAPLPWTHQETLALIQAYQEKWYSLKRGQLKAFQWEEVSVTVAARCGLDEPSKTATQCRHKIEKLRKRYRSELQKPYLNSWQYFELMDEMERGPRPITAVAAKPFPNFNSNSSNSNSNSGVSDDSDEKLKLGQFSPNSIRHKSKSINNIVKGRPIGYFDRGFSEGFDSDDDEEEENDGGGGVAAEIRGFTERFMGMESRKMEMLQETENYRMEMERKRMEMIAVAQRKLVDTIGRAFGAHKRAKIAPPRQS